LDAGEVRRNPGLIGGPDKLQAIDRALRFVFDL